MANQIPLVLVNGVVEQIQPGDLINPTVLPTTSGTSKTFAFFMG